MSAFFISLLLVAAHGGGVRKVDATPCDVVDVNLSLGMSVLLQFDSDPSLTFHADEEHFLVRTTDSAKRTIAIIPHVKEEELRKLFRSEGGEFLLPSQNQVAAVLDKSLRTNLFVFFKNSTRLMFRLRFVEKDRADYVVRVRQTYKKGCEG